jgi:hypothetical protein
MKIFLLGFMIAAAWLLVDHRIDTAHAEGFKVGMNYALKTNPPSEQLELVCAGLWVGEQNKKVR